MRAYLERGGSHDSHIGVVITVGVVGRGRREAGGAGGGGGKGWRGCGEAEQMGVGLGCGRRGRSARSMEPDFISVPQVKQ